MSITSIYDSPSLLTFSKPDSTESSPSTDQASESSRQFHMAALGPEKRRAVLLDLPTELRLHIYSYLIPPPKESITILVKRGTAGRSRFSNTTAFTTAAALMLTCSKMQSEVRHIIYGRRRKFIVVVSNGYDIGANGARYHPTYDCLGLCQNIELHIDVTNGFFIVRSKVFSKILKKALQKLKTNRGIKTFQVVINKAGGRNANGVRRKMESELEKVCEKYALIDGDDGDKLTVAWRVLNEFRRLAEEGKVPMPWKERRALRAAVV